MLEFGCLGLIILAELWRPRNKYKFLREGLLEDIFYLGLIFFIIPRINFFLGDILDFFKRFALFDLSTTHYAIQFTLYLVLGDLSRFILHVFMHRTKFWKAHKLHHSTTELSALSAFRTGYFEEILLVVFTIPIACLFKINGEIIEDVLIVYGTHGFLLHSNLSIKFPKLLSFIACPHFHSWHHSYDEHQRGGLNYGATFTFWDKLYGSYYFPEERPKKFGLSPDEKVMQGNFLFRFFYPVFIWTESNTNQQTKD